MRLCGRLKAAVWSCTDLRRFSEVKHELTRRKGEQVSVFQTLMRLRKFSYSKVISQPVRQCLVFSSLPLFNPSSSEGGTLQNPLIKRSCSPLDVIVACMLMAFTSGKLYLGHRVCGLYDSVRIAVISLRCVNQLIFIMEMCFLWGRNWIFKKLCR
jgi:hypothetical protein